MNEFAAISPQIWLDPVIANFRIEFASSSLSPTSFACWLDLSSILRHGWKHWLSSRLNTLCVLLRELCEAISLYTSSVPYFLVNCEPPKAIHFIGCKKWGTSGLFFSKGLLRYEITLTVLVQLVNLDMQSIGLKDSLTTVVCTAALTSGSLIRISGISYLLVGICFS